MELLISSLESRVTFYDDMSERHLKNSVFNPNTLNLVLMLASIQKPFPPKREMVSDGGSIGLKQRALQKIVVSTQLPN